ncbi:putative uncharacterized protein [Mycolicibacterium novocastrense]|uniref:Uncharacterized protein n=1 Tax=Mycolicibacterium novocastrense TaxID=59813 RepID=A0ABQ0KJH2_MYCNV|nr:putative uncharacterized protein [Mycolicibacterium novocastrense]
MPQLVDLEYFTGVPHQGHRPGEEPGVDRLADGRVVAVEFHRGKPTDAPVRAGPFVARPDHGCPGAKLPRSFDVL